MELWNCYGFRHLARCRQLVTVKGRLLSGSIAARWTDFCFIFSLNCFRFPKRILLAVFIVHCCAYVTMFLGSVADHCYSAEWISQRRKEPLLWALLSVIVLGLQPR